MHIPHILDHIVALRILFLLSSLSPLWLKGQGNDLVFFSVEDGLPQSQVYAIAEDPRGHLWLGTRGGGIAQFDGKEFRSYNTRQGLVSNYINALLTTSDDQLWIGTTYGASRYDGRQFYNYLNDRPTGIEVYTFLEKASEEIWMGTDKGIYIIKNQKIVDSLFTNYKVQSLVMSPGGTIWICHTQGLIAYSDQRIIKYTTEQGLPANEIADVWVDNQGRVWVATYADGLYQKIQDTFVKVPIPGIPAGALIWDLFMDDKDRLWLSTYRHGAVAWNPDNQSKLSLDTDKGLLKQHVHTTFQDSWGNIWLGTSGEGLAKYAGQQFTHYGRQSELRGQSVYALTQGKDSTIWLSQGNKSLMRLKNNAFDIPYLAPALERSTVRALYADYQGRIWIGTDGQGIGIWKDSLQVRLISSDGLPSPWIRDFVGDTLGNIWVANGRGTVTRIQCKQDSLGIKAVINQVITIEPFRRINTLHRDKRNRIWFGMNREGLGYIDTDSSIHLIEMPPVFNNQPIRCLEEDEAGYLWVGTGGGIARMELYQNLDAPNWQNYQSWLTSSNVYLLTFDARGQLWIGTAEGVDRASLDAEQNIIDVKHFGRSEGFLGVETCSDAVITDHENNIWFGTISGLTRYNPRSSKKNIIPPKLSLQEVTLFYTSLQNTKYAASIGTWGQMNPGLVLPFRRNHLSFDFIGINHTNPDQVRYRWRLQGLEEDWSPWTDKHDATYANIPSGYYTFMVQAVNEDGVTSQPLTTTFSIKPPIWITWWFILIMVGFATLVIVGIFYFRLNQEKRKNTVERERLQMEKSMIELEQKALRLQMNPHFIFHALNSIQGLIITEDPKTARYYLSKFSRLMRQVLENSREGLISLADEVETLENYLSLEQFCREQSFDYEIHIPEHWDQEEFLIPPMVIQPFVENAIIHGISHLKDRKGLVQIFFERKTEVLLCKIRDNGVGRNEAHLRKQDLSIPKKSTALNVTKERLFLLKAYAPQQESIRILDLVDKKSQPLGTEVQVAIPYEMDH
ncbi:MAG: two-component regulator propeller domain-containing protein [Bacteroidota bacterium]